MITMYEYVFMVRNTISDNEYKPDLYCVVIDSEFYYAELMRHLCSLGLALYFSLECPYDPRFLYFWTNILYIRLNHKCNRL